eukprot:13311004-Alexandrium_andersonii.AAC.1
MKCLPFGAFRPPRWPLVVATGLSAQNGAEDTPRELRGPILRPFLRPRSPSSERLKPFRMFWRQSSPATSAGTVWSFIYFAGSLIDERRHVSTTVSGVWANLFLRS